MSSTALQTPKLSFWQQLDLYAAMCQISLSAFYYTITAPLRNSKAPLKFTPHVILSTFRVMMARLQPAQIQYMLGGVLETNYNTWSKQQGVAPTSVTLADGRTKAFWIGNAKADNLLLYFPGGGFIIPGGQGHIGHAASIVSTATGADKSLSALVLQYDLASQSSSPTQLRQAVDLLRYATTHAGKRPSQILLAGDSAGCNIILGMLGHLLHPHPEIAPLKLEAPLCAVALASPWVNLACEGERYRAQFYHDSVSPETLRAWGDMYLGGKPADEYTSQVKADPKWWQGSEKLVEKFLIMAGSLEMMLDDQKKVANDIGATHPEMTLFIQEGGIHAQSTLPPVLSAGPSKDAHFMEEWILSNAF